MIRRKLIVLIILLPLIVGTLDAQQEHVNVDWDPHRISVNLPIPYGDGMISPIVHEDRSVTFKLLAPEAASVALAPGMLTMALTGGYQEVPFSKGDSGIWTLTVGPLEQDIYVYRLSVDGVRIVDPANSMSAAADQPAYSQLIVHGDGPSYYDARDVPHGAVTQHFYHSKVTEGIRELFVYTPPGYSTDTKYPVLYLSGGSGEVASNWFIDGRVHFIMDNLLSDGSVVPMIIVVPNNQMIHRQMPNHEDFTYDLFEADLRSHIIPFIDQEYSTIQSPGGRALSGLSMGGRHAQFIGFKSLDLFGSLGILSAGHVDTETLFVDFLQDPEINEKIDYLFVGQGSLEATANMGKRAKALHEALTKHNIDHEYYVGGSGGHDWRTWRHLLYERFLPGLWK